MRNKVKFSALHETFFTPLVRVQCYF